jgi:all-trans-retinol dehydrogenase (NAD+)
MSTPFWVLPREGVTLEALYRPFRATALNPVLTGPLLLSILKYPAYAERLYSILSATPLTKVLLDRLIARFGVKTVKILFVWGVLRVVNNYLARWSVNNWVVDRYQWDKEIVLVTGASSGFGELMVRDFARRGIKVMALDVKAPRIAFREPLSHPFLCMSSWG